MLQGRAQTAPALGAVLLSQHQRCQGQGCIALATEALVQLDHAAGQLGLALPELCRHLAEIVEVEHQRRTGGMGHATALEQLAAAGLAAPVAQGRIGTQQGNLEAFG